MFSRCIFSRSLLHAHGFLHGNVLLPRLASATAGSISLHNSNSGLQDTALKVQAKIDTSWEAIKTNLNIQPTSGNGWANTGRTHQEDISGASRSRDSSNVSKGMGQGNPNVNGGWQHDEAAIDSEKAKRDEHRWQSHQDSLAESTQSAFDTTVDARAPHVANSGSVVAFLKEQHQEIKSQFETVRASHGDAKMKAFDALRRLLAAHQAAEERVVHPVAQKELAGGETIIITRLQEEHDAKELLAKLEDMDVNTAEFDEKLEMLRKSVVAHAEAEEEHEFTKLEETLDQDWLETMRKAAELVAGIAPIRLGVESATATTILGPFASVVDRTRDALTGNSV